MAVQGQQSDPHVDEGAPDGMLIANFLHFIKHQGDFIARLRTLSERLLVVEYDGRPPSPWVPYPLGFSALRALILERGFTEIAKLGTRASRFGGELYSALAAEGNRFLQ
jgi:hypothetical protein